MVNSNTNKQQDEMKKSLCRRGSNRLNLSLLSYCFIDLFFAIMLSCGLGNFMLSDHQVKSFPYWHSQLILINDSGP